MTCQWHVRAELTEARVERARKSPVSRTNQKDDHPMDGRFFFFLHIEKAGFIFRNLPLFYLN